MAHLEWICDLCYLARVRPELSFQPVFSDSSTNRQSLWPKESWGLRSDVYRQIVFCRYGAIYTGRALGASARSTLKNIERHRNELASELKILPSCMKSVFQNVSKYVTSDHVSTSFEGEKCQKYYRNLYITIQKCVLLQLRIMLIDARTNIILFWEVKRISVKDARSLLKIQPREFHEKAKQKKYVPESSLWYFSACLVITYTCFEMWSRGTLTIVLFSSLIITTIDRMDRLSYIRLILCIWYSETVSNSFEVRHTFRCKKSFNGTNKVNEQTWNQVSLWVVCLHQQ